MNNTDVDKLGSSNLKLLIKEIEKRPLVLFLGAGIMKNIIGNWDELLKEIIKPAVDNPRNPEDVDASISRTRSLKRISRKLKVPVAEYRYANPSNMKTSPTLVVMKALIMALRADSLPYQKPIKRYEQSPMISQPMNNRSRLSERTRVSIPKAKSELKAKKRAYIGSIPPARGGHPARSSGSLGFPKL